MKTFTTEDGYRNIADNLFIRLKECVPRDFKQESPKGLNQRICGRAQLKEIADRFGIKYIMDEYTAIKFKNEKVFNMISHIAQLELHYNIDKNKAALKEAALILGHEL